MTVASRRCGRATTGSGDGEREGDSGARRLDPTVVAKRVAEDSGTKEKLESGEVCQENER